MSQLALDLGVPSTLVTEAVYARCLSALKDARFRASTVLKGPDKRNHGDRHTFVEQVRQALYASKIASYAQGYVQLAAAAKEHDWPLDYGAIAMMWRGGCIIRAQVLERIYEAYKAKPDAEIAALPGTELTARTALIPLLNLSLVCKEMLSGSWPWGYIALIFGSSSLYAAGALALAVRMFNREDVLFRS
jgi:6-phosphogluconate dehydrogenase (decarboxylating)